MPTDIMLPTDDLLSVFKYRCVICQKPAGQVHEIVPRSLKRDWQVWTNQVALCYHHHRKVHESGSALNQKEYLEGQRDKRLRQYYNYSFSQKG